MLGSSSLRRLASIGVFGALVASAACTQVFGFERSELVVQCLHHSDCGPSLFCLNNVCGVGCNRNEDCQGPPGYVKDLVCRDGACVRLDDAGPVVASVDGSPDGRSAAVDAATTDVASDAASADAASVDGCVANECGGCGNECSSNVCDDQRVCAPSVCELGVCRGLNIPGMLSTRGTGSANVAADRFIAYQIPVSPGSLTAFGIITEYAPLTDDGAGPKAYFGLYNDVGGKPDRLVASGAHGSEVPIVLGTSQLFQVAPPVVLTDPLYWIAVVFDEYLLVRTSAGHQKYVDAPWPPGASGPPPLPESAPAADMSCASPDPMCSFEPAIYLTVAQ